MNEMAAILWTLLLMLDIWMHSKNTAFLLTPFEQHFIDT